MYLSLLPYILLTFLYFLHTPAEAQHTLSISPPLHTYDKADYRAESQNWSSARSPQGTLYFANTSGLLAYDGEDWTLYPTEQMLRAVACIGDRIYVGGRQQMGYYYKKEGRMYYHSLLELVKNPQEIWSILQIGQSIIFQGFRRLYIYDGQHMREQPISNTTYVHVIGNKILYHALGGHLQSFDPEVGSNETMVHPRFPQLEIRHIMPFQGGLLLSTLRNGLLHYRQGVLQPLNNPVSRLLQQVRINKAIPLEGNLVAFATMHDGVVVGNVATGEYRQFNTEHGLADNRVHALNYHDSQLWVGTDNGISTIHMGSALTYYRDSKKRLGSVYAIASHQGRYYVGTNQGLYYMTIDQRQQSQQLNPIPGSEGQVWGLTEINGTLFCNHNDGLFEVSGGKLRHIPGSGGGYALQALPDGRLLQTGYGGLMVYKKESIGWTFSHRIEGIDHHLRDLVQCRDGRLLVGGFDKQAFLLRLNPSRNKVVHTERITEQTPLTKNHQLRIFTLDNNRILLAGDVYSMLLEHGKLHPAPEILQGCKYLSTPLQGRVFVHKGESLSLLRLSDMKNHPLPPDLQQAGGKLVYGYEHLSLLNDSTWVMATTNGLVLVNCRKLESHRPWQQPPTVTRFWSRDVREGEVDTYPNPQKILFRFNSLSIRFSNHSFQTKNAYEYLLEGYHREWQSAQGSNVCELQNLPEGSYTFKVRNQGQQVYTELPLRIAPPWYRTPWAYLAYAMLLAATGWMGYLQHRYRLRRQKLEMLQRKRVYLRRQREENARALMQLQANKLQEEISEKNDKLTQLLTQNNKKNEMLQQIREELDTIGQQPLRQAPQKLDKMYQILEHLDDKKDWALFETSFRTAHAQFFSKLQEQHPELTSDDLRLCAYLKIKLSSKEISPILQITPKSVELKRYRLRKKLGLEQEENLVKYIDQF